MVTCLVAGGVAFGVGVRRASRSTTAGTRRDNEVRRWIASAPNSEIRQIGRARFAERTCEPGTGTTKLRRSAPEQKHGHELGMGTGLPEIQGQTLGSCRAR